MADHEDNLLTGAFAEFREETRAYVRPAGVAAAHATVRTRKRNHTIAASVLAALFVIGPVTAYATVDGDSHGPPGVVGGSGSPTPEPPTPEPTVSGTPTPTAPVAPNGRISRSVLDKATLDIPDWGSHASDSCPSGRLKFDQGRHYFADSASIWIESVLYVDVDTDGAQETVVRFSCGDQVSDFQVAAFDRDSAGRIRTVGQVAAQTEIVQTIAAIRAGAGGAVEVRVGDYQADLRGLYPEPYIQYQWRTYGWNGTRFVQTGGPRDFPVNTKVIDLAVTSSDLVFGAATDGLRRGSLTVTVRNLSEAPMPYTLVVQLPTGLTLVEPGGCRKKAADGVLELACDQPALAPGGKRVVTLELTTPRPVTGTLSMVGVQRPTGYTDPDPENDAPLFDVRF